MSGVNDEGVTLLDQLKFVEKQGHTPELLKQYYSTECPPEMGGFYLCWLELHERRTYGEYGASPLTYLEIKAWKELFGESISPYGVEIICGIDRLYLESRIKKEY